MAALPDGLGAVDGDGLGAGVELGVGVGLGAGVALADAGGLYAGRLGLVAVDAGPAQLATTRATMRSSGRTTVEGWSITS